MAYTAPTLKSNANLTQFGNLPESGQLTKMTGAVGSNFMTVDGTGTPVVSPVTVNTTTQTITVPQNALSIKVSAPTAFTFTEDSSYTAGFSVPANVILSFDVWRQQYVYFKTTSSIAISFAFKILQ